MAMHNALETSGTNASFASLRPYTYAQLVTFRKSGAAVPTPVWFANHEKNIYVMTIAGTGKVKRIHTNGRVQLSPCTSRGKLLGDAIEGIAREMAPAEFSIANAALARKYGWLYRVFTALQNLRKAHRTFLEIRPV